MTFEELIEANVSRANRWHNEGINEWSPLEWGGAMAGETGEACNAAKKLKRIETEIQHHDARMFGSDVSKEHLAAMYRKKIGLEVADTIIYGLLMCVRVGVDPVECIREVFNKKSEEYGFPERI